MNYVTDVVDAAPPEAVALIELSRDGTRREWTFGEMSRRSGSLASCLAGHGVGRGDVVMTLIGNRSEWVLTMLACFRMGAVVLPCTEQLRAKDLRLRLEVAQPRLVVADERNRTELEAAGPGCPIVTIPDEAVFAGEPMAAVDLDPDDPCLITFTSGTAGNPKAVVHAQRYLSGQALQAEHWMDVRAGDIVWCTAASGWSKSARNVFVAPWIRGATALVHDARFDPDERLEILERERVTVLCMAPTEYRVVAKRSSVPRLPSLRRLVAAGEALNPEVIGAWRSATGLEISDGFGQTETGQLTGVPPGGEVRPGSMGRPLPGIDLWIDDGELVADPRTIPTFFLEYLGAERPSLDEPWRTGDRVRVDDDGYLFFEGRTDDVIISAGYRIGPFEVESALVSHDAVAEAAVVAAADEERGSVVRAVVTLRAGFDPSDRLVRELQDHVKAQTAPYKYPRIVDFVDRLPKTASGKIRRRALREAPTSARMPQMQRARELLFDYLVVARRGSASRPGGAARAAISTEGRSFVEGSAARADALGAALANGIASHAIELDDTYEPASLHPGVVVWPAVLALADERDVTLGDVLAAGVAGYDAVCGLGDRLDPGETYARGFHPTGVCGAIGAAVGASRLLGLDATAQRHAVGIATSASSGLLAFLSDGAWTKPFHAGQASSSGITAARLAAAGFTGPAAAVDGPHGFLHAFGGREGAAALPPSSEGSGVLGTSIKLYPCCRYVHGSIDLILDLVREEELVASDVASISCGVLAAGWELVAAPLDAKRRVVDTVDAQFSMPFAAALALTSGDAALDDFARAAELAPDLRPLMDRVECHRSERLEAAFPAAWGAEIEVRTRGGSVIRRYAPRLKGSPERMSHEDLRSKGEGLIGVQEAATLFEACLTLPDDAPFAQVRRQTGHRQPAVATTP